MNKFLVFISISALFVASNSFGDYIVCSTTSITGDNANTICTGLCKDHNKWTEKYNTTATNNCSGSFCVCYGTANTATNITTTIAYTS